MDRYEYIIAKQGLTTKRKDKDTMSDTGGKSKGRRREPNERPPRSVGTNRYRKRRKTPEEYDKDNDRDPDKTSDMAERVAEHHIQASSGFVIRRYRTKDVLLESWNKTRERAEKNNIKRMFGWPRPKPTSGKWVYWQGGAWGGIGDAKVFSKEGVTIGAAKRHIIRGIKEDVEVAEISNGKVKRSIKI